MLRQRDVEPIRQALDKLKNRHNQQVVLFHKLENLRDRLIDQGDDAIAEVLNLWPDADRQQHGGNDGCGEDKAVLQGKQEPIGQHDRADQHAAERFELKAAPTR
jgi:hypothetical protein